MAKRGLDYSYNTTSTPINSVSLTKDNYLILLDNVHFVISGKVKAREAEIEAEYAKVQYNDEFTDWVTKFVLRDVVLSDYAFEYRYSKALEFNRGLRFFKRVAPPSIDPYYDYITKSDKQEFINKCIDKGLADIPDTMLFQTLTGTTPFDMAVKVIELAKENNIRAWHLKNFLLEADNIKYYIVGENHDIKDIFRWYNHGWGLKNEWLDVQQKIKHVIENVKVCEDAVFTIDIEQYNKYAKYIRDTEAK